MNSVSGLLASLAHKFDVVMHVPAIPLVGYALFLCSFLFLGLCRPSSVYKKKVNNLNRH